jgi:bifunctional NMN adenylyltransferase/nudix hydrolase
MSEQFEYDVLVFVGRFQPFHIGHKKVVQLALNQAKEVLILIGSSFRARDIKNPFTFDERKSMILNSFFTNRIQVRPLRDYLYNNSKWMAEVQKNVDDVASHHQTVDINKKPKIGIIGYEKDSSSWYLREFPQYKFVDVGRNYVDTIHATTIRNNWFSGQSPRFSTGVLDDNVHSFIYSEFSKKEYERLVREYENNVKTKQQWQGTTPYEVIFQTVDAVLIQSGHVLLVKRRSAPGEGTWAIPGGYLNANERIEDGMIRELREETKIKVPDPVLRGSIKARHRFDAPNRSIRGRIITDAFLIELPPGPLPQVKGADDALKAKWVPLAAFEKMEDQMFEDHNDIINYFLGRV